MSAELIDHVQQYLGKNFPIKLISQGAEALVFETSKHPFDPTLDKEYIIKYRPFKKYRHEQIDRVITKKRTVGECRCLVKLSNMEGINVPQFIASDPHNGFIWQSKIGQTLKDGTFSNLRNFLWLNNNDKNAYTEEVKQVLLNVGKQIGILHTNQYVHGDLTSSNIVLQQEDCNGKWVPFLIDFGLSGYSTLVEDKGVDLYVLERAILSTHSLYAEKYNEWLLEGYKQAYQDQEDLTQVLKRFEEVRLRGRKRSMLG
ncbi:hypothetical protein QEN19_002540 [Hanseniaspora menglaensis]